nr:MAG TPA: hypothetical protein [Caudoviricetes sp.]
MPGCNAATETAEIRAGPKPRTQQRKQKGAPQL